MEELGGARGGKSNKLMMLVVDTASGYITIDEDTAVGDVNVGDATDV